MSSCPELQAKVRRTHLAHARSRTIMDTLSSTLRRLRMRSVGDVPFFLAGSCRLSDHVTFAVGRGADGLEAYDLKVVGRE